MKISVIAREVLEKVAACQRRGTIIPDLPAADALQKLMPESTYGVAQINYALEELDKRMLVYKHDNGNHTFPVLTQNGLAYLHIFAPLRPPKTRRRFHSRINAESTRAVVLYLNKHPRSGVKQIASGIHDTAATVLNAMGQLADADLVEEILRPGYLRVFTLTTAGRQEAEMIANPTSPAAAVPRPPRVVSKRTNLSATEIETLAFIDQKNHCLAHDVATKFQLSQNGANSRLRRLIAAGCISRQSIRIDQLNAFTYTLTSHGRKVLKRDPTTSPSPL